ncbi:MAG: hypothetical protein RJA99_279 [Pseudomonadota bacterium]|jgi:uncharacterized NAD(P)/FAD-binding protein YdhS
MKRIVVVGAGFSGVTVAAGLARASAEPLEIVLVDPRPVPGHGLAHGTVHPDHRLNGPAAIHTIYPDAPLHFVEWVRASGALDADPGAVAPNGSVYPRRHAFGRYMAGEFERHARANPSDSRIEHVRDRAVRLERTVDGLVLALESGRRLAAGRCVLALGWSDVGVPPPLRAVVDRAGWIGDPWHLDRIASIPRDARVLLLGSGLTASDTFAALAAQGHRGPVTALSRRGLRPGPQSRFPSTLTSVWGMLRDPSPAFLRRHGRLATIRDVMAALRRDIAGLDPAVASWHAPFDELRDSVTHLWPWMGEAEQRRYVRHAKGWYDTFRFRNPPQVERIVDDGVASGQLAFVAGRLREARAADGGLELAFDPRRAGVQRTLRADAVINCTGPQPRPGASGNPLWRSLIADGLVRDHPCGVGVDVDAACRVRDRHGRAHDDLLAIGPPTIGAFGEASAVPYIARQVLDAMPALLGERAPAATDARG